MTKKIFVVGISGKQGSGKTTLAKGLLSQVRCGHHVKFADPLYDMHEAIRGVLSKYGKELAAKDGKLLQLLGTEWGRNTQGENIWVDLTFNRIQQIAAKGEPALIVVDDCRFPNELSMFRDVAFCEDVGVLTVRLECDESKRKVRAEGWRDTTNHPSETALDGYENGFDMVVDASELNAEAVLSAVVGCIGDMGVFNKRKPYIPGGEA